MDWQIVIGLEVHVQLNTLTKLFCGCANLFGSPPNHNTCPVCLGHSGTLPTLNEKAYQKAIQAGIAFNSTINNLSKFDRKNYFYPDLPKGYQISQLDKPICSGGLVEVESTDGNGKVSTKTIHLTRIHLEEDAGKLIHSSNPDLKESYVDLNRAGSPLIEIVSEPEISNSQEAVSYLQNLRDIVIFIGVTDGNMAEGSLRCDANISIKKKHDNKLGNRTEIKNMNTFKGLQEALEYEIKRQKRVLEAGDVVKQETLLWNANDKKTVSMRSKEGAHDYRYFPEPDLPHYILQEDTIEELRRSLPELPQAMRTRFQESYQLSAYDAKVLTASQELAAYYEEALKQITSDPKKLANWISTEILSSLNEKLISITEFKVSAKSVGELVKLIADGDISGKIAKDIFPEMIATGKDAHTLIKEKGLTILSDAGEITALAQKIIDSNPDVVEKYKSGNQKVFGFFVGEAMKITKGQVNPKLINQTLRDLLS